MKVGTSVGNDSTLMGRCILLAEMTVNFCKGKLLSEMIVLYNGDGR